ncbi:MAG TPA: lipoyl(octanoyl) transferase LipB [Actinomycetota bacterium]|jgi:lipoyl(octanoyl) transferase|nr:lipoyl(octanoyl) transferase LipB [Actinomycetota bacterium]
MGHLLMPGVVPYGVANRVMHELAERRQRDEIPDTLILLEHPPVYTAGRRTDPAHLLSIEQDSRGAEVHHVDRGGSVTFHGPGQLVGYPIIRLPGKGDVIRYLRDVEEVILRTAAEFGVGCERSEVNAGVWSGSRKVCAIGVRTSRGVTLHGFALNCTTDLSWFDAIVPCGLPGYGVTTLSEQAGRQVTVEEVRPVVARRFGEVFDLELEPLEWFGQDHPMAASSWPVPAPR